MSYIDETYGKQLEEALRGLVSRPALGQPWFGFHASEVPAGVLLFTATTHSRVLYADFWKYIQDKNLVKTEEEWQSIYSEQGWCPFYSDGDGIDTFRMPSAPLYLHGADTSDAGTYTQEGLPDISGHFNVRDNTDSSGVITGFIGGSYGCFSHQARTSNFATSQSQSSNDAPGREVHFDASKYNAIYGASNHVTPETSKILFGVWTISASQQPIPDATVEGIISELGVVSNNALEALNGLNGAVRSSGDTMTGPLVFQDGAHAYRLACTESEGFHLHQDDGGGGTYFRLWPSDNATNPGGLQIRVGNPTEGNKYFIAKADGSMTFNGEPIIRLVESWRSGDSWYNIYSNGYIEQGGTNTSGTTALRTIKLHTPMKTKSYNVGLLSVQYNSDIRCCVLGSSSRELEQFKAGVVNGSQQFANQVIMWKVCGY